MRKTTLPKHNWRGMTTWMPTHAPNLWIIRPESSLPYSRAMHADHPWDVTLTSRLFPSGSLTVVHTTVFPTPHARTPRDLGFPLLVTGVWFGNLLFQSILYYRGAEAQGLHAPTGSPPTVLPPTRLSLPVGIRRGHFPCLPSFPGGFIINKIL